MTIETYLLLGTNLGDRIENLKNARDLIALTLGKISKLSRIYETAAWGNTEQPVFFNQVICLNTELSAKELLNQLLAIEKSLGRTREKKWEARLIDLDILYYGEAIVNTTNLIIPHPELPNRRFTLVPLLEIAAEKLHPAIKKTTRQLLKECPDKLAVKPV